RPGACRPRLYPSPEIRCRHHDSDECQVTGLRADRGPLRAGAGWRRDVARSVVVASGARYRRPEIENLSKFEGRGVWYWASPIEARLCADQEIVLVGGGNSAGQAAVFLSGHARKVFMVIRGGGLGASMSRYLIERIEATPNIELVFN